ncbi:hypothetical protein Tel_13865 [Candidatus Tenderia electrophaga]|jgi:nickel transport protein|uniref:Nickel transporter n=1 Tax=Candidatus Tenderia electrophaga TaxID=1748243 RepID=A0A0S2TG70_9GAMM|nr:hypothetical protein Tel_13865 [Candidatus Tenderia electrophaga]
MNKHSVLLLTAGIAMTTSIQAHDVWLEGERGNLRVVYGHVGELQAYDPDKVKAVRAYNDSGKDVDIRAETNDHSMRVKPAGEAGMITVEYDNGYWTKIDATTWENQSKRRFDNYLDASHSLKYNKNLLSWSNEYKQPTGLSFEIVPLENPLAVRAGDKVTLQVYYQGKPLADAGVEVHGFDDSFKTDAQGKVEVPLNAKHDLQHIAAYYRYDVPGHLDADEVSLTANLVFHTR